MTAPDHYRRPLLPTPFGARTRDLAQVDRFIPWNGYSTVDVFTTVEQEYFAIRNAATLYDLSPMAKYRIAGPEAEACLDRLVTRDVTRLRPGRVAYVVWCNDAGHVVGDGTLFRLGPEAFRLCTGERQLDWLAASAIGFDVAIADESDAIAGLALQGPTSASVLRRFGLAGFERLKPFDLALLESEGVPILVSRTGFTGDLGYELWLAPEAAPTVWDRLMAAGRTRGLRPIGSAALNLARLEAGFLMPNVDFVSAEHTIRLDRDRSPFELGLDWLVDLAGGHFTGRRALLKERERGPRRRLVGLDIEGNKPAANALIYADGKARRAVGAVTSAAWSPTGKRNIALAMVEAPHFAPGSRLWAEIYLCRELVWERRMASAQIVERPFFVHDRRRATPPADQ